jgi:hypothetical protein
LSKLQGVFVAERERCDEREERRVCTRRADGEGYPNDVPTEDGV